MLFSKGISEFIFNKSCSTILLASMLLFLSITTVKLPLSFDIVNIDFNSALSLVVKIDSFKYCSRSLFN